jgi:hypothetical protein
MSDKTTKPKVKAVARVGKEKHYVNAEELKQAIAKYYETDDCTDYLCECINKIAQGLSFSPSFISHQSKFSSGKGNSTSWFTCAYRRGKTVYPNCKRFGSPFLLWCVSGIDVKARRNCQTERGMVKKSKEEIF